MIGSGPRYVQVPPPPFGGLAAPIKGSLARAHAPLASAGGGMAQGGRLGSPSINDTTPKKPSDIAWDSYKKSSIVARSKYGKLLFDFCRYMEMCDNSGFKASGISLSSSCRAYGNYIVEGNRLGKSEIVNFRTTSPGDFGKRSVSGPLLNRWHPQRRIAWIAKMCQLALWYEANRIEGCTLISLTGYQENSGLSIYDTWDNINESRVKLLKILRKYLGKISYFWVVEPHTENNTGYPHYHLAVFREVDNNIKDSQGVGMEDKLRRLYSDEWGTGSHTYGLDFQVMKGDSRINDLKNYLMKYISKGYVGTDGWSEGELIFNAHLYGATHGYREGKEGEQINEKGQYNRVYRLIGMSRDLSKMLKPEEEDKEQIVWLDIEEVEPTEFKDPDTGEITTSERTKPLYQRQLIPDWLDDAFWIDKNGIIKKHDPQPIFFGPWGRSVKSGLIHQTPIPYDPRLARKLRNKDTAW